MKNNIRTTCGIEKYNVLSKKKGFLNRIRFIWFIIAASIRDFGKEKYIKKKKY